jgi:hypothetical protein
LQYLGYHKLIEGKILFKAVHFYTSFVKPENLSLNYLIDKLSTMPAPYIDLDSFRIDTRTGRIVNQGGFNIVCNCLATNKLTVYPTLTSCSKNLNIKNYEIIDSLIFKLPLNGYIFSIENN